MIPIYSLFQNNKKFLKEVDPIVAAGLGSSIVFLTYKQLKRNKKNKKKGQQDYGTNIEDLGDQLASS